MPVKTFRPLTPSTRYITYADYSDITKAKPEKSLVETRKRTGGRNVYGRVTARGIGGGNKQKIRLVDFQRKKHGVEATVTAIEYDPRRTARLARRPFLADPSLVDVPRVECEVTADRLEAEARVESGIAMPAATAPGRLIALMSLLIALMSLLCRASC